jgi:GTP-binding protein
MNINFRKAKFKALAATIDQCPASDMPEIVMSGRSNVGKSSLINALVDNKKLARVSQTPGKTRAVVFFEIDGKLLIADLPGYGYAKRSKKDTEKFEHMITTYILDREQMTNLFLLIDVRLEPQQIDLEFMEWLGENGVPFSVVFTKADKLAKAKLKGNVMHYLKELEKQWEELPPYFVTSSEAKTGREEILNYIEEINRTLGK